MSDVESIELPDEHVRNGIPVIEDNQPTTEIPTEILVEDQPNKPEISQIVFEEGVDQENNEIIMVETSTEYEFLGWVFPYLNPEEIVKMTQVNSIFRRFSTSEDLWRRINNEQKPLLDDGFKIWLENYNVSTEDMDFEESKDTELPEWRKYVELLFFSTIFVCPYLCPPVSTCAQGIHQVIRTWEVSNKLYGHSAGEKPENLLQLYLRNYILGSAVMDACLLFWLVNFLTFCCCWFPGCILTLLYTSLTFFRLEFVDIADGNAEALEAAFFMYGSPSLLGLTLYNFKNQEKWFKEMEKMEQKKQKAQYKAQKKAEKKAEKKRKKEEKKKKKNVEEATLIVTCLTDGIGRMRKQYRLDFHYEPQDEIKVIGCSVPRTGTFSTRFALDDLGYKTYHGSDNFYHHHHGMWVEAFESPEKLDAAIAEILKLGYNATIDFPSANFCLELIERFPNAKVIISVRDNPEVWLKSSKKCSKFFGIFMTNKFPLQVCPGYSHLAYKYFEHYNISLDIKMEKSIFPWVHEKFVDTRASSMDDEAAIKAYLQYISNVKVKLNEVEYLEFNVKMGWDPLVEFLGIPKPSHDFPRVNDGQFMNQLYWLYWFLARFFPLVVALDIFVCFVIFKFLLNNFLCPLFRKVGSEEKKKEM